MNTLTLLLLATCAQVDGTDQKPLQLWPDNISSYVQKNIGAPQRIGYSRQQLASFPGYTHRLGYVSQLFNDVEALPETTNRLATQMLASSYDEATAGSMRLLGARIEPVTIDDTLELAIQPMDTQSAETWESLPEGVRNAVEQLVRGCATARPLLHESFDWSALARATGDTELRDLGSSRVYQYAAGAFAGMGGRSSSSLNALKSFNATPLGNAAANVFASVRVSIQQLQTVTKDTDVVDFQLCRLKTEFGSVAILGRGDNVYSGGDAIVIDLGGNDRYSGRLAVPTSKNAPVGLLIDTGGNDTYDGRQAPASLACGLFGIGALFDLAGHDKYYCGSSGLGCAWHGIGLLLDTAGNDTYSGQQWTQGAAHAGAGMLIDEAGDDQYFCQLESQGLGATLGVGALIDKNGDDRYHAYDNENGRRITFPSSQTRSHEVSLSQGCGYGRRADNTDGRSMAGGVGALFDGAGDDSYYGGVFSQAIGFWWSVGMLVDLGGNDTYRGVYYAQGAAAHFAVGSLIDHSGNDQYNDRSVKGQVLGAARDGAVAAMLDGAGDDVYFIPKKSAGGGDMNGIGVLSDKGGNDRYQPTSYTYLGTASASNPRGEQFRRSLPTLGIFVDLAGQDQYPSSGKPKNGARWFHQSGPPNWGFGLDTAPRKTE